MRPFLLTIPTLAVITAVAMNGCGKADDSRASDSSSAAPAVESFSLTASKGTWTGEITPARIVFTRAGDSVPMAFNYSPPRAEGVTRQYTSIRMAADTHRIDIALSTMPCTDVQGTTHEQSALVWLDQVAYRGCASRK